MTTHWKPVRPAESFIKKGSKGKYDENIEKVEKEGDFQGLPKKEYKERIKIEELINRATTAKSLRGYLLGQLKVLKAQKPDVVITRAELIKIFEDLFLKYNEYEKMGVIEVKGWRGASSIEVLVSPERITIHKYKRKKKGDLPKRVTVIASREELNCLISAINACIGREKIETVDIARFYYNLLGIKETPKGDQLYDTSGKFIWDSLFVWRKEHNRITTLLDGLDELKVIEYSGGVIKLKGQKLSIQEILDV